MTTISNVSGVSTTEVKELKMTSSQEEQNLNSVFGEGSKKSGDGNSFESDIISDVENLKPTSYKEFLKNSFNNPASAAKTSLSFASGNLSAEPISYLLERNRQNKDINAIQEGLQDKILYADRKQYKRDIKENPELKERAVLIQSDRFKAFVVANSDELGVEAFDGNGWENY